MTGGKLITRLKLSNKKSNNNKSNKKSTKNPQAQTEETESETPKGKGAGGRPKNRKNNETIRKEKLAKAAKGEFKMEGRC